MDIKVYCGDYKIGEPEKNIIMEVLDSGRISEYKYVAEFEKRFAKIIGVKHCTLVSSGTSALIAALTALIYDDRFPKIQRESKVITTPLTYIATSNAIVLSGLEPIFIDVDLDTFNINADGIEQYLMENETEDVSLLLPVHLLGFPADMGRINSIAESYNLTVLEDSAQAHGSKIGKKIVGSLSTIACYSFYIAHNIQVGEMGAVVTNDKELNRLIKKIKANGRMCDCIICTRSQGKCPKQHFGRDPRFLHDLIGYNFKTMEFQAALGILQLEQFNEIIKKRQDNVKYLNDGLADYADKFILPAFSTDYSYLAYPLIIKSGFDRDKFRQRLLDNGIESRPLFGCIPTQQPAYSDYQEKYKGKLPNAEFIGDYGFYIGCHQYIERNDLDYVIDVFKKIVKEF